MLEKKKKKSFTSRNSLPQANKTGRQALKENSQIDICSHTYKHTFKNLP